MSDSDNYLKKFTDDFYYQGYKNGFIMGGLVIGAITCAVTWCVCYRQFGPPSKVPDLSLLIGDMRRAKEDSEGMAYSLKDRWRSHIISDVDCRIGAGKYRDVASRFNGISATLEAMLSTGHDDRSAEAMRAKLDDAQQRYQELRRWFDLLPREHPGAIQTVPEQSTGPTVYGAAPEIIGPAVDLAKHFFDGMKEMDKIKRNDLIKILRELHFKPWPEIPEARSNPAQPSELYSPPPSTPVP